jgi:hypothetical protein
MLVHCSTFNIAILLEGMFVHLTSDRAELVFINLKFCKTFNREPPPDHKEWLNDD